MSANQRCIYGNCAPIWIPNSGQIMFNFPEYNGLNVRALLKRNIHRCLCARKIKQAQRLTCVQAKRISYYTWSQRKNHFNLNRKRKRKTKNNIKQRKCSLHHRCVLAMTQHMLAVEWNGIYLSESHNAIYIWDKETGIESNRIDNWFGRYFDYNFMDF